MEFLGNYIKHATHIFMWVAMHHAVLGVPNLDKGYSGSVKSLDVYESNGTIHLLIATTKEGNDNASLYYTSSSDQGGSWKPYRKIKTSIAPAYARGRGTDFQIAAFENHVLCVWMQHGKGFMGRGPLSSAISLDGGGTWRNIGNPADDGSDGDHAFIDLTADNKGNFHAVWLDKRSGKNKGLYTAVYNSQSNNWMKNRVVDDKVCDCCWNIIKASQSGSLYALYRDKAPRDMGLAFSGDYGKSWKTAGPVGDFNWMIDACIHMGGGLAIQESNGKTILHAVVWTGNHDVSGLYYLSSKTGAPTWNKPFKIDNVESTLPDISISESGTPVVAWINQASGANKLFVGKIRGENKELLKTAEIETELSNPTHPKLLSVGASTLLFWTGRLGNRDVWRHCEVNTVF